MSYILFFLTNKTNRRHLSMVQKKQSLYIWCMLPSNGFETDLSTSTFISLSIMLRFYVICQYFKVNYKNHFIMARNNRNIKQ